MARIPPRTMGINSGDRTYTNPTRTRMTDKILKKFFRNASAWNSFTVNPSLLSLKANFQYV